MYLSIYLLLINTKVTKTERERERLLRSVDTTRRVKERQSKNELCKYIARFNSETMGKTSHTIYVLDIQAFCTF
jgi:phenylpyruvate tautomerase PptA (4-oxalocrotonate tautomerase family)